MAKPQLDQVGSWAIAGFLTAAVVGPVIYFMATAQVNRESYDASLPTLDPLEPQARAELVGEPSPFGYEGPNGPESWSLLSAENHSCADGGEQSPIDLDQREALVTTGVMKTSYRPYRTRLVRSENRLLGDYMAGHFVNGDQRRYFTQSVDFHVPSEHALAGKHYDLEMQIEHKANDGRRAQVSLMFTQGDENKALGLLLATLTSATSYGSASEANFDLSDLLPSSLAYYHYRGSETTPPCREGVAWYVLQTPLEASSAQIDLITEVLRYNARPLQRRNNRQITITKN